MHSLCVSTAAFAIAAFTAFNSGTTLADERQAEILANTCFSCHGTEGRSTGDMPSIHGKSSNYIAKTLKRFRDGEKSSTVMVRIAKGFTDEEIDALASYFSSKK